jgi:uncharacterized membrane protein YccC
MADQGTTAMPTPEEEEKRRDAVLTGLRVATACSVCLVAVTLLRLDDGYLSVITCLLVMAQYTYTAYQKGVERILGRVSAVAFSLLLVLLLKERPAIYLTLLIAAQLAANYLYASGRLTYLGVQAAAFSGAMAAMGITSPVSVVAAMGVNVIVQVVLGVVVANAVNWLTGAEFDLTIHTEGSPLLPLRPDWLNQAVRMTVIALAALLAAVGFSLPEIPTMVSAFILGSVTDLPTLHKKGWQRAAAPVIALAYGFVVVVLLHHLPYFSLLLIAIFAAQLTSTYVTRTSANYSYVGLQTGLAIPMVLVSPPGELSDLSVALQRLTGVMAGFAVSLAITVFWPVVPPPPVSLPSPPEGR